MRSVLAALCVVGSVAAGGAVATSALREALATRKQLVTELSAVTAMARKVDAIVQQLDTERGNGKKAEALLVEAVAGSATKTERDGLEKALACVRDPACTTPARQLLAPVQDEYVAQLRPSWTAVETAERAVRRQQWIGAGLALLGPLAVVLFVTRRLEAPRPAPPGDQAAPPVEPDRTGEQLLKERLEALYSARAKLGEGARFAAFGELAAGLSHGLKTPLASVLAAAQLAQLKLGAEHPANAQLDEIIREAEGLTEQVQRFLRAAGSVGPSQVRVPLKPFVEALAESYAAKAAGQGLTFEASVEPADAALNADEALLEMAMRNLVENALAVAPRGTAVRVAVAPCEAPVRAGLDGVAPVPGVWLAISVEDRGPGLPAAAVQGQIGVTTKRTGSGLGVAIARRVVERHGGALVLEHRPEGGAAVRAIFPAASAEEGSA